MADTINQPPRTGAFTDIHERFNSEKSIFGGGHTLRAKAPQDQQSRAKTTLYEHKSWSGRKMRFWSSWRNCRPHL